MNKPIDHAEEAARWVLHAEEIYFQRGSDHAKASAFAAISQAHAALALLQKKK